MELQALLQAINTLSWEDLKRVQQQINQRRQVFAQDRIRMIEQAVVGIREGMSQAELDDLFAAMNREYVEPADATESY